MPSTCRRTCSGVAASQRTSAESLAVDPQLQAVAVEAVFDGDLAAAPAKARLLRAARDCCASRRARGQHLRPRGVARPARPAPRRRRAIARPASSASGAASAAGSWRIEKMRVGLAGEKLGMPQDAHQQLAIGAQAVDLRPRQRMAQPPGRFGPRRGVDDDLGQHRIVVRRDHGRLVDGRIDAQAGSRGNAKPVQRAGGRADSRAADPRRTAGLRWRGRAIVDVVNFRPAAARPRRPGFATAPGRAR